MGDDAAVCRYCRAPLQPTQRRCRECGSWLSWRAHILYPETLWALVGLIVAIAAATCAGVQATVARAERASAAQLKEDVGKIAENVTKMAFVLADGSRLYGGVPDEHIEAIRRYEENIRQYLPPGIDKDIQNTIRDLNEQIRKRNQRQ